MNDMVGAQSELVAHAGLASIIVNQQQWVHRRVESVHFTSDESVRRRVSVDFTIHPALPTINGVTGLWLVPLAFLEKRELERLDVKDESGATLPVLTTAQNAEVSKLILNEAIHAVVGHDLETKFVDRIAQVVEADISNAKFIAEPLAHELCLGLTSAEGSRAKPLLDALLSFFAKNFLLITVLHGQPGDRRVIKFSYEKPLDEASGDKKLNKFLRWVGLRDWEYRVLTPSQGYCKSYHLELESPDGLVIQRSSLGSSLPTFDRYLRRRSALGGIFEPRIEHIHFPQARGGIERAEFWIRVARQGWLSKARTICLTMAIFMTLCLWRVPKLHLSMSETAPILMGIVAVFATLIIRDRDHPTTARMLTGLTTVTHLSVSLPAIGALILLFGPEKSPWPVWAGLAAVSWIFFVVVAWAFWRR